MTVLDIKNNSTNDYSVNTGYVYSQLVENWKKLDRHFLQKDVEDAYVMTLSQKKIFYTETLPTESREQEVQRLIERYKSDAKFIERNEDAFPLVGYHTVNNKGVSDFVDFAASCELSIADHFFPLFFSLQLCFTGVLEVQAFLSYHLDQTFEDDIEAVEEFLANCLKQYPLLFDDTHRQEMQEFLQVHQSASLPVNAEGDSQTAAPKGGFTTNRRVLFFYYIFDKLGVNRNTTSVTEMARVVQGLTGSQLSAKDIKNTDTYKRLSNPLKGINQSSLQNDLVFVRNQFERLKLNEIAQEISKEIHLKE